MRELSAANLAQITADYFELILLCKIEFSSGHVFLHSSYGAVVFDGATYIGVGNLGSISTIREQAPLGPSPIELILSGLNPTMVTEALDTGEYKAPVTIYEGYRQDDGTLVDDPWVRWSGWWEHAAVNIGTDNLIRATAQHDLAVLNERDASRYSDEHQKTLYPADNGFEYTPYMADLRLAWAGGSVGSVVGTVPPGAPGGAGGGGGEVPGRQK